MTQRHFLLGSLLTLLFLSAPSASAYFTPEEVLLNQDFFIPPSTRATTDRVAQQQEESETRRDLEQQMNYDSQHPTAPAEETQSSSSVAAGQPVVVDPLSALSDPELKNTLKLLQRIEKNQQHALYADRFPENVTGALHAGAPGLAPTGAGGILSAVVMVGSVLWTLSRAKRATKNTRR